MFKHLPLITTILLLSFCVIGEQVNEELDEDAKMLSDYMLGLIEKYDVSGTGAIPVEKYPSFLSDVFLTGHSLSSEGSVSQEVKQLLFDATTGFTGKYNGTEVGIQDFYMDLVKDFTIYLTNNQQKYESVLQTFFSDTPQTQNQTNQSQEKVEQSAEL